MQLVEGRPEGPLLGAVGRVKETVAVAGADPRTRRVADCSPGRAKPLARSKLHRRHELK